MLVKALHPKNTAEYKVSITAGIVISFSSLQKENAPLHDFM